jgi:hypothetical protein
MEGLRSHGSLHEAVLPFIFNRLLVSSYAERLAGGDALSFELRQFN